MARPASSLVADRIAAGHNAQGATGTGTFGPRSGRIAAGQKWTRPFNGLDHLLDVTTVSQDYAGKSYAGEIANVQRGRY
jgi:hypothetical protein